MQMENLNFYILTGGPGSGKSTVLKLLSDMGYLTVEETGRNIIQKQIKSLGDAVPWNNVTRYARLMFLHAITDFEELVHVQKICFFDRGILDILGYCRLINIPITTSLKKAAHEYRYNPKVFLFPPWEEIYTNDTERKQDFKDYGTNLTDKHHSHKSGNRHRVNAAAKFRTGLQHDRKIHTAIIQSGKHQNFPVQDQYRSRTYPEKDAKPLQCKYHSSICRTSYHVT